MFSLCWAKNGVFLYLIPHFLGSCWGYVGPYIECSSGYPCRYPDEHAFLGHILGPCWAYVGPMLGLCWALLNDATATWCNFGQLKHKQRRTAQKKNPRRSPKMLGTYSLNHADQLRRTPEEHQQKCVAHFLETSEEPQECSVHFWGASHM